MWPAFKNWRDAVDGMDAIATADSSVKREPDMVTRAPIPKPRSRETSVRVFPS